MELELATGPRPSGRPRTTPKRAFLANMSHELRTPLNAVIGYAEMLKSEVLGPLGNEKYSSYAGNIMFAGQHLLDVVSDILDLARLEGGRIDLNEKITELPELLDDVLRLSKTVNDGAGPTLELGRIVETVRVNIDPRLTRQALVNLISDAQKFHPARWYDPPRDRDS
ncbi:MAG: sensor histidine kinase [Thalassobaculum sp.]